MWKKKGFFFSATSDWNGYLTKQGSSWINFLRNLLGPQALLSSLVWVGSSWLQAPLNSPVQGAEKRVGGFTVVSELLTKIPEPTLMGSLVDAFSDQGGAAPHLQGLSLPSKILLM